MDDRQRRYITCIFKGKEIMKYTCSDPFETWWDWPRDGYDPFERDEAGDEDEN
jgi:hypothetical protein